MAKPDPLDEGHIPGQNPATPERVHEHTRVVESRPDGNEEDLGGRPAFLFRCGDMLGVTLDSSGANLPVIQTEGGWTLERYFTLGIRDVGLDDISPESIIRGIRANGYHIWRASDPSRMQGTTQ